MLTHIYIYTKKCYLSDFFSFFAIQCQNRKTQFSVSYLHTIHDLYLKSDLLSQKENCLVESNIKGSSSMAIEEHFDGRGNRKM